MFWVGRQESFGRITMRPHVIRVGDAVELIEAEVHRIEIVTVAEVPLAGEAGGVAVVAEELGEGDFVGVERGSAAEGVDGAGAVGVAAGHEHGAGRRAEEA